MMYGPFVGPILYAAFAALNAGATRIVGDAARATVTVGDQLASTADAYDAVEQQAVGLAESITRDLEH